MDDRTHLIEEIRAAREEQVRKERHGETAAVGGMTTPRDPTFYRLRTLSADELTAHIQRLERDLQDLERGPDGWASSIDVETLSTSEPEGDS